LLNVAEIWIWPSASTFTLRFLVGLLVVLDIGQSFNLDSLVLVAYAT
jgi:hypothetical protein